jgi:hypothetical protein
MKLSTLSKLSFGSFVFVTSYFIASSRLVYSAQDLKTCEAREVRNWKLGDTSCGISDLTDAYCQRYRSEPDEVVGCMIRIQWVNRKVGGNVRQAGCQCAAVTLNKAGAITRVRWL